MKKITYSGILIAGVLSFILLACASPDRNTELLAQITITTATQQLIQKGEDPAARAKVIYQRAVEARTLLAGEAVTLPQLEKAVRDKLVNEKLTPAELQLVDSLVRAIAIELSRKVGSEHLNAEQKLAVERVLDWVIAAASLNAPHQPDQT